MPQQYDIKVWQQMLTDVKAANTKMRQRIDSKAQTGYVVISNTFDHCVCSDENRCATVQVVACNTEPVIMPKSNAERIANTFKAYCGVSEQRRICWQVMNVLEYYRRLVTRNERMIEILEEALGNKSLVTA